MAYSGSKAQTGQGTTLSIGATPTLVGEITSGPKGTGRKNNTTDVTNLDSTAEEFKGTIPSSGSWEIEFSRVGDDAGQTAMETAFAAASTESFAIQFPKTAAQTTSGDKITFDAVIEQLNYSVNGPKDVIKGSATLKVSGPLTITPGT